MTAVLIAIAAVAAVAAFIAWRRQPQSNNNNNSNNGKRDSSSDAAAIATPLRHTPTAATGSQTGLRYLVVRWYTCHVHCLASCVFVLRCLNRRHMLVTCSRWADTGFSVATWSRRFLHEARRTYV